MFDKGELWEFLIKAKKRGYAADDSALVTKDGRGATTILFKEGDWEYQDEYYGGEPFGGSEKIFYKGGVVWMMVYYGRVYEEGDTNEIYPFLRRALLEIPHMYPFRGPTDLKEGDLRYENIPQGSIDDFSGSEYIFKGQERVYSARYIGGFIDQR